MFELILEYLVQFVFMFGNLTPHVLSEWMVEVCGGEVYWVLAFELV